MKTLKPRSSRRYLYLPELYTNYFLCLFIQLEYDKSTDKTDQAKTN
jgi:hypothetical protein